jgi:tRNA pseudouridine32 synthase/23S rRNA pseudouridine746 synthase
LGDELLTLFGPEVAAKAIAGEVVDQRGVVLDPATVLSAGASVYLYRDLRDEVPVPFDIPVLYQDDDIVVIDKPHFLATIPRGRHIAQTALVRMRRELGLPELSPAHRLDRLTAGVLLFTARRELRGAYQTMFARGAVHKTYLARAAEPNHQAPRQLTSRRRTWRAQRRDAGGVDIAGRPVPADAAHRTYSSAAGAYGFARSADLRRPVVPERD